MGLPPGFAPFTNQSRLTHAGVVIGGALACLGGYVGAAELLFGADALAYDEPASGHRIGAVFGSLACWGFYTVAFIRAKGGPVTNIVIFPISTVAVVPFAYRWIVFGPVWESIRARIAFIFFRPGVFIDAAALILPGLAFSAVLLAVWSSRLGEEGVRAWQRENLSVEFRREFVDE